jgi:hypothetical protein
MPVVARNIAWRTKMKTMKALRFEKYGPPSVLSIEELPLPNLRSGEVLIELYASAINPSDVKNVAGAFHRRPHGTALSVTSTAPGCAVCVRLLCRCRQRPCSDVKRSAGPQLPRYSDA